MSPFNILQIPSDSTPDQVKKKFRQLSSEHHPDKGGDSTQFMVIKEAYDQAYKIAMKSYNDKPNPCPRCNGLGGIKIIKGFYELKSLCQVCKGSGLAQ